MMLKRTFDVLVSLFGLLLLSPVLIISMVAIWRQDGKSPFYIGKRVGKGNKVFGMVKLRSMVVDAEATGVSSTSVNDMRITPVGSFVRRYKIDELTQLWNVFIGDMSFVGPRPNVQHEVENYTKFERKLITVRPGITDLSSIVFSDEGEILAHSADPDHDYDQLIRPWKSRLGVVYIENRSFLLDLRIIYLTISAIFKKETGLTGVVKILEGFGADKKLIEVAQRTSPLQPSKPPENAETDATH